MRFWSFVLILLLMLPALAGEQVANVKLVAYEYFDEYARKWYQVDSLCIREITGPCEYVEQSFGGVESAEITLRGLKMESQYRVKVRWSNGTCMEESYTVYEPGTVHLSVDMPSNY